MSLSKLPEIKASIASGINCEVSENALNRWSGVSAAVDASENSISILDVIGFDWRTGEGVTAKRISAALRSIGPGKDVDVLINSPGGNMFEGVSIYNLLREHKGKVTVKIVGLAASAASIIAMAGDEIQIGKSSFMMIHNSWNRVVGNRHDLREMADFVEPFDESMAGVYSDRSGISVDEIKTMMDDETWLNGESAVEKGFADLLLSSDITDSSSSKTSASAVRRVEAALRSSGMPRSEAMKLINEFKSGLSDSPKNSLSDSADIAAINELIQSLRN